MPQLAGQSCVICAQRIAGDYDSRFCPVCGCPYHLECARPSVETEDPCSGCGASVEARTKYTGPRQPAAPSVVDPRPRECPYCELISPPGTVRCECGFDFARIAPGAASGEKERLRDTAASNIRIGLFTFLLGAGLAFALPCFPNPVNVVFVTGALLGGGGMFLRGFRQLARSNRLPSAEDSSGTNSGHPVTPPHSPLDPGSPHP